MCDVSEPGRKKTGLYIFLRTKIRSYYDTNGIVFKKEETKMLVYESWMETMFTSDKKDAEYKLSEISTKLTYMLRKNGHVSLGDYMEEISDAFELDIKILPTAYEIMFTGTLFDIEEELSDGVLMIWPHSNDSMYFAEN